MATDANTTPVATGEQKPALQETCEAYSSDDPEVERAAKASPKVFDSFVRTVKAARQKIDESERQLPLNAEDAVKAALRILHHDGDRYPADFEDVLCRMQVLNVALNAEDWEEFHRMIRDLPRYVERMLSNLEWLGRELDKVSAALGYKRRLREMREEAA